jgi:chromosome segregation ATPase
MLAGGSVWLLLQKCVAQDMVKDLEASSLELESCLNEQVSLQLQLLQLLSDLQHEQAIAATRIKERDRAIKRMKEVEVEVEHLHSQLPVYKQEKEKASREVKNLTHSQDDLCKTLPIL